MRSRPLRKASGFPRIFFFIGSLELILIAIYLLATTRNPLAGGWLFSQLFAFGFTLFISLCFFVFGLLIPKNPALEKTFDKFLVGNRYIVPGSFAFCILGLGVLITPTEYLQGYAGYFQSLRYLLFGLSILPLQMVLIRFGTNPFRKNPLPRKSLRLTLIIFLLIAGLLLIVNITKLGVTPDNWWNVAGTPLTTWQLMAILLTVVITVGTGAYFRVKKTLPRPLIVDILIVVSLYLITFTLWQQTPMTRHYFSMRAAWPAFQPFPLSDARVFDLGAISIIKGWGINFGSGTQSPLYLIFLAGARLLAGNNYFLSGDIQIAFLAFISPTMYLFGKRFHSRTFGLIAALILVVRQANAVFLSGTITTTNPRVLMTEIPTLFGLLLLSWSIFTWLKHPSGTSSNALIAGGILGATCLIRLNPILLFPLFLIISLLACWKYLRKWLFQASIFSAGFLLVLSAWFLTGRDAQNRPYLLLKFRDIINSRYEYELNQQYQRTDPTPHYSGVFRPIPTLPNDISLLNGPDWPFFIANHALHNLVGSFLSLPDSFSPADQLLENLAMRPYLNEDQNALWQGGFPLDQTPMLVVNGLLLSYGIAWSWKKWRWAGLVPLLVALGYALSLGFARTSGGRYLVPMDWVIPFYYSIPIVVIVNLFLNPVKPPSDKLTESRPKVSERLSLAAVSILLIGLFVLILFADNWVQPEAELCDPQKLAAIDQQLSSESVEGDDWSFGEVLYPYRDEKTIEFVLLTCRGLVTMTDQDFAGNIKQGQTIVALPKSIYEFNGTSIDLIWQK